MTPQVIVFAAAADEARALDLVAGAGEPLPLVVSLSEDGPPLRHGDSLVAIGLWSEAARAAGLARRLESHLTFHPNRSILCVLDDLPLEPTWSALDPGVMILKASASDGLTASLASAISLAQRRGVTSVEETTSPSSSPIGGWTISAIASGFVLVLGAAGLNAWTSEPPSPEKAPPAARSALANPEARSIPEAPHSAHLAPPAANDARVVAVNHHVQTPSTEGADLPPSASVLVATPEAPLASPARETRPSPALVSRPAPAMPATPTVAAVPVPATRDLGHAEAPTVHEPLPAQ
ncbi:MAG: hypothetical protein JNM47_16245 [Hyphomonadaceae bacterium]|nr:hypothetical protein [Hyphomonadaceae bacterium]